MTGCPGKLRVKATAMCIIVRPTYTRFLLNNRREAESIGFLFSIFGKLDKCKLLISDSYVVHCFFFLIFQLHFNNLILHYYFIPHYICIKHGTLFFLFHCIKYTYRTDSKKSNRGYENRNRTKPWTSWTVPALIFTCMYFYLLQCTYDMSTQENVQHA